MIDLGSLSVAGSILFTLALMIAPAACFLGLWRLLDWLRDDRLIAELSQREEFNGTLEPSFAGIFRTRNPAQCSACGAPSVPEIGTCPHCGHSPSHDRT